MSPQNSYVETLTPKMMLLGDGPSEVTRSWGWSCHEWD